MSPPDIPPAIRSFLSRYVRSIEQLEILLLFAREPARLWSAPQVYDAILSSHSSVERWLREMAAQSLLETNAEPTLRYRCTSDAEVIAQISALAALYRTSPVRVIEAIYRRDTPSAAQSFADAFKLKPTDPHS